MNFLPYNRQSIDDSDIEAVINVLRSDFLTTGPQVESFEQALIEYTGSSYSIACSSGTAALHLAMHALGIGPGDLVVVPSITFVATANAVRLVGGEVLFADVDPDSGLLTAETLRNAINNSDSPDNIKAVIPVHLNGQVCDMEQIAAVGREFGLYLVEDAAHALGAIYSNNTSNFPVGYCCWSDMVTFSFHPVKSITCGEGGAVMTNSSEFMHSLSSLRNHGIVRDVNGFVKDSEYRDRDGRINPWYYEVHEIGLNYRITDLQCALGISQLSRIEKFMSQRRELAEFYDHSLEKVQPYVRPIPRVEACLSAWHLYVVFIDFEKIGQSRAQIIETLREQGIGAQVHYIPVHQQPYYLKRYGRNHLSGAEKYYKHVLSLPLFVGMTKSDVTMVVETLAKMIL